MDDVIDSLNAALSGRYTVERELGHGGMARVFLAQDEKHNRPVAIKVLRPEFAAALGAERFLREITIAAQLNHPHILALYDSGEAAGLLYYIMPFVAGESLRDRLERESQLPLEDALKITRAVADALSYAHSRDVVHRDIKPENILLESGHAMVADFGIARAISAAGGEKLTDTGLAIGTPSYMSPEQASGEQRLDGRSDVYSLGCVIYEMLAGTPPYVGPTAQAIVARRLTDPVPPLKTVRETVPSAVEQAIVKALAKVPADRFATATQFAEALSGAGPAAWAARRGRRRMPRVAAIGLGILAIAAAATLVRRSGGPAKNPLDSNLVAVLPFRVTGADPSLHYLREGMVDLLAIKLTGEGGPRAVDPQALIAAWRVTVNSRDEDPAPEAALRIARGLGAGRLIDGGVVGTSLHLTLTAAVRSVGDGGPRAQTSVEGPADSLDVLVDQLAVKLLALQAGVEQQRFSSLTGTSLPAVQTYLEGQAAFRMGRFEEAQEQFEAAVQLDSTFALAALGWGRAARWTNRDASRSWQLANEYRHHLSARDRAVLRAYTAAAGLDQIQAWKDVTAAYPDLAEGWNWLADTYLHFGALVDLPDALGFARDAYARGFALDSAGAPHFPEHLVHLIELAHMAGDTATVHRLVAAGLAVDSTGEKIWALQWHMASVTEDSTALAALWARATRQSQRTLYGVYAFTQGTGIGVPDGARAAAAMGQAARSDERSWARGVAHAVALNGGRPREARTLLPQPDGLGNDLRSAVFDALYWEGDTLAAIAAVGRLVRQANAPLTAPAAKEIQYWNACVVEQWRLAHGDTRSALATIERLQSARDSAPFVRSNARCAALLDAMLAAATRRADAALALDRLDSIAKRYACCDWTTYGANLVAARLREAQGDLPGALRLLRRRAQGFLLAGALSLSTFLREEGRVAALAGDREGAIRAYSHYLALRPDPEPALKAEVDQVRAELARLVREARR